MARTPITDDHQKALATKNALSGEALATTSSTLGNHEALDVAIRDASGNQITNFDVTVDEGSSASVTSVGDTTTSTQLKTSNSSRKEIEFYNTSTAILYLLKGTGTASSTNFTVQLSQNDYYSSKSKAAFQGVWASDAGGVVLVTEST